MNVVDSLIGAFSSPSPSPIKHEPTTITATEGEFPADSPRSTTTVASTCGVHHSYSVNQTKPNHQSAAAMIPYESHELRDSIIDATSPIKFALTPVKEDASYSKTPAKAKADKSSGWVGIGFDGEAMALSVCSDSPDTIIGRSSSIHNQQQPIPNAIDFKRFESSNLPKVEEDKISIVVNSDKLWNDKRASTARKVLQDVEELSVDLSVLGDAESISSVMTTEDCLNLAKRLEKMERQLLDLAGETNKVDALRALAKATHKQSRRADSLQKKVRSQEKKIRTLDDLCQRLLDGKRQYKALQSTSRKEMNELKDTNANLTMELHGSESRSEELACKLSETSERVRRMEEENVQTSRLLLQSYSEKNANHEIQCKFNDLREETRKRAKEDRATIQTLESELAAMLEAHAKKEKRSASKVHILMEMKYAMEEQIRLLEGDDASV
eukprot:CAMPEP_0172322868 /NCGR_PEP_ID=MMETSP1058-20130122/47141_1 /TAXON_ID=83371 /ORGANISM="Detonula confervacea, Strain CCMP 353" /LENGTH=440 /DNA_ID=CAMNT_0013038727 /DNA_START=6 /DNA_END=1328 /DNA_ORIENTATION=+